MRMPVKLLSRQTLLMVLGLWPYVVRVSPHNLLPPPPPEDREENRTYQGISKANSVERFYRGHPRPCRHTAISSLGMPYSIMMHVLQSVVGYDCKRKQN